MRSSVSICAVVCLLSSMASAQVSPFRGSNLGLSEVDISLLMRAAESLYVGRDPKKNIRANWSNPTTGNSGIVKIAGVQTSPRHCIVVAHQIRLRSKADPRVFTFKRCKSSADKWELVM